MCYTKQSSRTIKVNHMITLMLLLSAVVSAESVVQCGREWLVYGDRVNANGTIEEWHFWVSL